MGIQRLNGSTSGNAAIMKNSTDLAGKLRLPEVTLVTVDTACHELTRMAIEDCVAAVEFGDIVVFSDKDIAVPGARWKKIKSLVGRHAPLAYRWLEMPKAVRTSHVLIVEWDSWILDPSMWRAEFLDYDYIGAPWGYTDGLNVGNGGFSLRSKRLLDYLVANTDSFPFSLPEDETICRRYRPALETKGFRWPGERLAFDFSYENVRPEGGRHFGFHGLMNWAAMLTQLRLERRAQHFNDYVYQHPSYTHLCERMPTEPALKKRGFSANTFQSQVGRLTDNLWRCDLTGINRHVIYGPYRRLPAGSHEIEFKFKAQDLKGRRAARLRLEVVANKDTFLADRYLPIGMPLSRENLTLRFDHRNEQDILEFRIRAHGYAGGQLEFGGATVRPAVDRQS